MVNVDPADLADAMGSGFRQDTAEKVHRLLLVLREIEARDATRGKFTLKGGTALNIFHLPDVPRLSVDIDIIATGFPDASARSKERENVIQLLEGLAKSEGYNISKTDSEDSGCTLHLTYNNTLGTQDKIKIDLDVLGRQTLLPPEKKKGPRMFLADDFAFPTLAPADLFAQKLVAVAYRAHARDLYDMHRMLGASWHKLDRARELYFAHSFLKDHEWYRLAYPTKLEKGINYEPKLLDDVLRGAEKAPTIEQLRETATKELAPHFTERTNEDEANRQALLKGEREAFARIAGEKDPERTRLLIASPALAWRLEQAARRP